MHSWYDNQTYKKGLFFHIPKTTLTLIYRLRSNSLRNKYTPNPCTCSQDITLEHIFNPCRHLLDTLTDFLNHIADIKISYTPENILSPVNGQWDHLIKFAQTLKQSDIGHLI